jgi:hypothetical protein
MALTAALLCMFFVPICRLLLAPRKLLLLPRLLAVT